MEEIVAWYESLPPPFKIGMWVLGVFLVIALLKRLTKLAILVTILIILILAAGAIANYVP